MKNIVILLLVSLVLAACGSGSAKKTHSLENNQTVSIETIAINEAPKITIHTKNLERYYAIGDKKLFQMPTISAVDKEDGNLTSRVQIKDNVKWDKEGKYTIDCSVSDSKGHVAKKAMIINIVSTEHMFRGRLHQIPVDANLELGNEDGIVYYVDPRHEENGKNRALRIDYANMSFSELNVSGINPHSLDRAGESDKFYVRTQNSNAFDVINFETNEVKTVPLTGGGHDHKPRAIGATNLKWHLQLLSAKDMQVIDVIDTKTDEVIATLGDKTYPSSTTTGHALWFDLDHFGLIDRSGSRVIIYKVIKDGDSVTFKQTDEVSTRTSLHAIERVAHPRTREDLVTFYGNGEGNISKGGNQTAFVREFKFNPKTGKLTKKRRIDLLASNKKVSGRPPITHHSGVTPDGKYFYAPVFDGHVYIIDRSTMKIVETLKAALGAAHIEFSSTLDLAIITNHWSNELTIIDLKTQTVKKRLIISEKQHFDEQHPHLLQPHFSYLSKDGKYYYTFATQDGDFLEINLETFEIDRRLHTGGAPEQAHS